MEKFSKGFKKGLEAIFYGVIYFDDFNINNLQLGDMMKKLFLIFTLFLFSCNVQAQDGNYKLLWDYNNPVEGVTHYNVFLVELIDTTATPFTEGQLADGIRSYQVSSLTEESLKSVNADTAIYNFVQSENGLYIQAALTAVNGYGESLVAVSGFYKKPYILLPNSVHIIRIGK